MKNYLSFMFFTCIQLFTCTQLTAQTTTIERHGITWEFEGTVTHGTFVNGDPWVVGPANLLRVLPETTTDSNGDAIHGSMLNPGLGSVQGFDSRIRYNTYYPNLNIENSLPLQLNGRSVIVSSRSHLEYRDREQLKTLAVLTFLSEIPPTGSFRPPTFGNDRAPRWTAQELDLGLLQSLPLVPNSPTDLSGNIKGLESYWNEQNTTWTGRLVHATDNQPDYGRDMADRIGSAFVALNLDYPEDQKRELSIHLIQRGLDIYGAANSGGVWKNNGGHNHGRKLPLLFAAKMLNDDAITNYGDASKHFIFQEDQQVWYVTQDDVGRPLYQDDGRRRDEYIQADVGIPEWGEKHHTVPRRDGRNWGTSYRTIVGSSIMGHVLSARLMNLDDEWNWPALFDYIDRYWSIEKESPRGGTNQISELVWQVWNATDGGMPLTIEANSLTRHGITWTFDQPYPVGQYANGDPWVVGPVTITSISPIPAAGRNGTVINPTRGSTQGFDNRISNYNNYDENLNVGNDLPLPVAVDSSVVSSISNPGDVQWGQIDTIAILTVVSSAPAVDSFRPGYIGNGSRASNWTLADVDYSKLASLSRDGLSPPDLATLADRFEKVWYEQDLTWTGRYMHMPYQAANGYGKDMAIVTGNAALSLNLDYSNAEKTTLLTRYVQYGIDIASIRWAGGRWYDTGGQNVGRLAPLLVAGTVLDDSDLKALFQGSQKGFSEYCQTFFVTMEDVQRTRYTADGRPRLPYTEADIGTPEWGETHNDNPSRDGNNWNAYYRDICGGQLTAPAMTARVMDIRDLCNWEPMFLYQERHVDYEQGPTYQGEFNFNPTPGFHKRFYNIYKSIGQPPIDDSIAPTCTLTGPTNGATLMGAVQLAATAADDAEGSGLASVVFRINGNSIGTATSSGSETYTFSFNTSSVANGSYTLQAVATDNGGNQGFSSSINITIDNPLPDLSDGLLAYWVFNDNSGSTAADLSGNNNDAIIQGAMWTADAQEGSALDFDGTDDYVDAGNLDIAGNAMTIALWMQSDNLSNGSPTYRDARIISKATGTGEQDHYWMVSTYAGGLGTTLRFRLKTDDTTSTLIADNGNLVNDQWYHIAAVYDGTQMRLYQDGVEIGQLAKTGALSTSDQVATWIGRNPDGARPFDGRIDDVRIYNRALSASDILALANGAGLGDNSADDTYTYFQDRYPTIGSPTDDDDQDQLPNLYEYFAGLDPTAADAMDSVLWMEADAATASFNFMSPVDGRADLIVEIQKSTDMRNWATIATRNGSGLWPNNTGMVRTPMGDGMEHIQIEEPININTHCFYRLRLVRELED